MFFHSFKVIQDGVEDLALIPTETIIHGGQLILDAGVSLEMFESKIGLIVAVSCIQNYFML